MAFCAEVVDSLINLSEKVSKYREDTDSLVPKKQYVEWQALFKSGESFADVSAPSEGGVHVEVWCERERLRNAAVAAREEATAAPHFKEPPLKRARRARPRRPPRRR